ncbi:MULTISPECIES: hypothetical protein [unclassified Spirosoma]|uniref:hypothetical protein n=1 Tax=unclassified Spirosoma TaxID=2621999 RepID=UPI0009678608|nr:MULTISPECIES: hypothetical protein [unclassified Spirosoma]MBN8821323.1 hypothetical protein [Spirosoma sp.]OJW78112.1 MAG: hypothetical protein BGO59_29270 [Spirosoma sp. 48-14]
MIQPETPTVTTPSKLDIPTFADLVTYYGPYLGLIIALIIVILILQYVWFKRVLKANAEEIKRLVDHEKELSTRLMHFIDQRIGFKPPKPHR